MLALPPPLKASNTDDRDAGGGFSVDAFLADDDCFLDSIDFSSIFEGFDFAGDLLPELEIPEPHVGVLSESSAEVREEQDIGSPESPADIEKLTRLTPAAPMTPENRRATAKHSHGKKKMKVDWTPELHRRFVMAVEELGVDKAVPSRILEIMGNHNLTRHNVASHLQKYRSHRKHSLAREAEAGSWSHRRQIYAAAAATGGSTCINPTKNKQRLQWVSPTVGYPPPSVHQPQFGPLHVWGHPTVDRPTLMRAMWQGHSVPFQCPQPPWPQPQNYIAYWRPHFHGGSGEGWGPTAVTPAPHFIPQPLPGMRYAAPVPVAGVQPQPVYRPHLFLPPLGQHHPQQNAHPSKESIDAAIGDVLAKPWLPLPLGLKPPSTESVLGELQRHGVPKVPPPAYNNPEAR